MDYNIIKASVVARDRSVVDEYQGLVGAGQLNHDRHQVSVVRQLEALRKQLNQTHPPPPDGIISRVMTYII